MAKKLFFGIPKQYLLYPLIAVAIATFGFGIYMGRMQTAAAEQPAGNSDWRTYVSPEGWSISHPQDVIVMQDSNFYGFAEEGAFFTDTKEKTTLFSEENIHGSRIQMGTIPNQSGLPLTEWVGQWKDKYTSYCYCTVRPDGYHTLVIAGGFEGQGIEVGTEEYSSYFVFIPLTADTILWGNVSTNDQRDASNWSVQLLKDMLGTFSLQQL